jgi:hypothetical protein
MSKLTAKERGPPKRHWKMSKNEINLTLDSVSEKSDEDIEEDYTDMRKS